MAARVTTPFSERLAEDSLTLKFLWAIPLVGTVVVCLYLGGAYIVTFLCLAAGLGAGEFFRAATPRLVWPTPVWKVWLALAALAGASLPLATWLWPITGSLGFLMCVLAVAHLKHSLIAGSQGFTIKVRESQLSVAAADGAFLTGGALSCLAAVGLAPDGVWWLVLIAGFNIISDTFSSVCGKSAGWVFDRMFGPERTKMFPPPCPKISPGKTRIGFFGGGVATIATGIVLAQSYNNSLIGWLALAISLAAPCGDLYGSALKRSLRIKDWSTLLGPHGGLNDRLDSFLFTAPAAYLVLLIGGVITL